MNDFSFHILTLKLNFLIKSNSTLMLNFPILLYDSFGFEVFFDKTAFEADSNIRKT